MDPVSAILAALVAGATSALRDTASSAIKDSYAGLKSLLKRHFGSSDAADEQIKAVEGDPHADLGALRQMLEETEAATNSGLVEAAQAVLAAAGQPTVVISGSTGVVGNNYGTSNMTFGS